MYKVYSENKKTEEVRLETKRTDKRSAIEDKRLIQDICRRKAWIVEP